MNKLGALRNFCVTPPADGAFYFLLKLNRDLDPLEIVRRLVREHRVAVIPGTAFGMNQGCYLRVAYGALEEQTVSEGMDRLATGLTRLSAD